MMAADQRGVACLIGSMVAIQMSACFAKELLPVFGCDGTTLIRLALGCLILLAATRTWPRSVPAPGLSWLLLYGAGLAILNYGFYHALESLPLALLVALETCGPLFLSAVSSREPLNLLFAACAGLGIAVIQGHGFRGAQAMDSGGIAFALLAGAGWASYLVAGRRLGKFLPGAQLATGGTVAALLVAGGLAMAGGDVRWPESISMHEAASMLSVALLGCALPYSLEAAAMRALPTHRIALLVCLEPAVAALCGWVGLHENLRANQWLGAMLIAATCFAQRWSSQRGANRLASSASLC